MSEQPAIRFLRTLCAAVLREVPPAEAAARAHSALAELWSSRRSFVLEVRFTGFLSKGERIGGVEPSFLRAAGQLIVHRTNRVGFTPEVREEDLATLFDLVARPPAELGGEGVVGALRTAAPRGIFLGTSTGEVYKPAPAAASPPAVPTTEIPAASADAVSADQISAAPAAPAAPSAPPAAVTPPVSAPPPIAADMPRDEPLTAPPLAALPGDPDENSADLAAFEFVEDVAELAATPAAPTAAPAEPARAEEPSATDMYHFFRASSSERTEEESEHLPELLRTAENMSRYDELAESCARNALRHLRAGDHLVAASLLSALATEAERSDRTRLFRESAETALRGISTAENLPHIVELLQFAGNERERVLQVLFFLGGEAVALLENHLFRTPDMELRRAIFRHLLRGEGGGRAAVSRALADTPARARVVLELVTIPEVDPEQAGRWVGEAAAHPEPAVRTDAARAAATFGGRTGMRVLVDLLGDADRAVRRAALHGLASMQDAASVPFLTRFLNDNGDDDLQLAAVAALGRTGSADAIPPLLAIVNKRQLFGGRKAKSLKLAAIEAIGRTGVPSARDALTSISTGSDADLSAEARRALATLG